jgi:cellulose synthase/poly-beta-1,6-N-acetylglucosamine synthase-like glycosyltransferase
MIAFIEHSPFWIIFLTVAAILISGQEVLSALFAYLYQKFIYPKFIKSKFDSSYLPRCSIIMATKGITKHFEKNIQAFRDQDYPDYEVIFSVEDLEDEGVPIIRSLIQNKPNCKLVVAGYAKTSSQTNKNLLKGLDNISDPSVLVFADNDICPKPTWLRSLILPLSDPQISVTTGYRWVSDINGDFCEQVHALMNMTMYVNMHLRSYIFGDVAWGGSTAIRREVFSDLNVAKIWSETISDDLSLMKTVFHLLQISSNQLEMSLNGFRGSFYF